ncbi:hypothetical protein RO3G_07075 [Rhizopus delemar RA 99-880]|uniref:Uncharacterized protein n=1 Tax=Rhizopus delemar (strain RA 99-880 / ATCC MYA-4621 / FGSC 9543 / NRRL 43880) TaxID=246409 RepID=I1C1P0_RHIO9|nr:hypothetical protein RO3G_07075 [Rhizopus delemar RA 99-880]|eukprot:EIE82370.1 hypothetical protein RO3G_07075 [Rhizopus delemar RA 99-880]
MLCIGYIVFSIHSVKEKAVVSNVTSRRTPLANALDQGLFLRQLLLSLGFLNKPSGACDPFLLTIRDELLLAFREGQESTSTNDSLCLTLDLSRRLFIKDTIFLLPL